MAMSSVAYGMGRGGIRRLETQADGQRLAVAVLYALLEAGTERCRANVPAPYTYTADPLIFAMLELKERATIDACIGFAVIMTDAIGTRALEPRPQLYEHMEIAGAIRPYNVRRIAKRMRAAGLRLASAVLSTRTTTETEEQ